MLPDLRAARRRRVRRLHGTLWLRPPLPATALGAVPAEGAAQWPRVLRQRQRGRQPERLPPLPTCSSRNASESEEDHNAGSVESQVVPSTHRVTDSKFHSLHAKMDVIKKGHARDSQRYKVDYESQSTDTQNFSSESKRETEYGPCRREMEDTLNHLKFLNVLSPRGVHIPNCDKKGFYKKKQCRPSKGRKRGFCWCVDKYGQPLPGYDTKGRDDVHCLSVQSQ
ncbi:Insulin-like growth factor-binding protein 3 [Apodemus speciosus]|uniref:Insulin-like growth factor-binding protein 3 n=1 Tax=Apodemus speciosus TaxID=105296 RepID=A0ABQ0F986_APOSI